MANQAPGQTASPTATSPSPTPEVPTFSCDNDSIWDSLELKALQTGTLQSVKEGIELPAFHWQQCSDKQHCEQLVLTDNQKLLAVGQNGSKATMVVSETCGDNTAVLVGAPTGPARTAFRGVDMSFDSGVVGGDRFLLSGFARHRTDKAREGFVPRDYLVTGREGEFAKLEPARNKQNAKPLAAASQIVQVTVDDQLCTTLFWKLGIAQCDFARPTTDNTVVLGSHMIYGQDGKGMKWNAKDGAAELLPSLEWIVTDGVNVAWAADQKLYTANPRWDLPTLEAEASPGAAGDKPVALGCGRLLSKQGSEWVLRNIKQGTAWSLDAERFPSDTGTGVALGCDAVTFGSGHRISFAGLGAAKPVK